VHSDTSKAPNVDALFFMLSWTRCGSHKKCTGTGYPEVVVLHPVETMGHVVHSGAFSHETLMRYFSYSGGLGLVYIKSTPRHVTLNVCFFIWLDLLIT
jgi:hypothetical protein